MRALIFLLGLVAGFFGFAFLILFFGLAFFGEGPDGVVFNGALALISISAALLGYWKYGARRRSLFRN